MSINRTPKGEKGLSEAIKFLLSNLYVKCLAKHNGATFSMRKELEKVGIYDQRFWEFLLDMNVIKKTGRRRATKWYWNENLIPSSPMSVHLAKQWRVWKALNSTGNKKYGLKLKPYPQDNYQEVLFKEAPVTNYTYTDSDNKDAKIDANLMRDFKRAMDYSIHNNQKRYDRWNSLMKRINTIERQNEEILSSIGKPLYIRVPVLFGLFTVRRKLIFNN